MAAVTVAVRDLAEAINVLGLKVSVEVSSAGETGRKFAPMAEEMRTLAEKAMAAASAMDNAVAASAQAHTAHSLAVNKNAAAVKRAAANAAKTGNELAGAAAAANATVGQVSVLATALEGMAQAEALSAENAGAILRAARDMGGAVKDLDAAAVSLAAFAARFTALSEDFAAAPDGNEPFLAAPRAYRTRQKQLD
jgi:methyl-accepting chemotaxis protein